MLTVHTTTGVTTRSNDWYSGSVSVKPYYYLPLRLLDKDGNKIVDLTYNAELKFPRYMGPARTSTLDGIIEDEPFVNVRSIMDDDYPIKENRLHNCHHDFIEGEISLEPSGRGDPSQKLYACRLVSTWPSIAEVGEVVCLDSGDPRILLDESNSWSKNQTCIAHANVWTPWCAYRTYNKNSKVYADAVFYDAMNLYVGKGEQLGLSKYADVDFYVRGFIVWSSKIQGWSYTFQWNGLQIQGNSIYSISAVVQDVPMAGSMHFLLPNIHSMTPAPAKFSSGYVTSKSNLIIGGPDGLDAFQPPKALIKSLRARYITNDVREYATLLTMAASQTALVNTKQLDINSIMYLKDFSEVGKLIHSFTDLYTKGINPKTVSSAYLAYHYGVRLTVKDTKKIIGCAKRLSKYIKKEYSYTYGRETGSLRGVDLQANVSIAYGQYDSRLMRLLDDLSSFDLLPTPSRIWDMFAYTFLVDWIVPVGDALEAYDAFVRWAMLRVYRSCASVKATVELDVNSIHSFASGFTGFGRAAYVRYVRTYSPYPPIPLPWLRIDKIDPSWNLDRFLVSSALLAQRTK